MLIVTVKNDITVMLFTDKHKRYTILFIRKHLTIFCSVIQRCYLMNNNKPNSYCSIIKQNSYCSIIKHNSYCSIYWTQLILLNILSTIHNLVRINLPLFFTVVPSNICMFLSCRPFVVITTLSTGLVGVEVTPGLGSNFNTHKTCW